MFEKIELFEKQIADFYGAPYAVATDCCTHAVELCLRKEYPIQVTSPYHTYLSIPMTYSKLDLDWYFTNDEWEDYYYIGGTRIIDAAVLWKKNSYIENTLMCLSFQFKKHLNLGRGGAILCQTEAEYIKFKKMSYDGRIPNVPWEQQDIDTIGYHYYMTPETAILGLEKLPAAISTESKKRNWTTYPDISKMKVFNI
jgi:dTDP-4-amino-4,6-dideoxygalactose transaminase